MEITKEEFDADCDREPTASQEPLGQRGMGEAYSNLHKMEIKENSEPSHDWEQDTCTKCGDKDYLSPDKYCSESKLKPIEPIFATVADIPEDLAELVSLVDEARWIGLEHSKLILLKNHGKFDEPLPFKFMTAAAPISPAYTYSQWKEARYLIKNNLNFKQDGDYIVFDKDSEPEDKRSLAIDLANAILDLREELGHAPRTLQLATRIIDLNYRLTK